MSKAEKTRQFIIEKTAPVFNRKGYVGTSINDMMAVTGLTKGSIYGNFENKDEVGIAAFKYNLTKVRESLNLELDRSLTYKEQLLSFPKKYKSLFQKLMENGGCPIQNTAIESDDTHPVLKEMADNAITVWKNYIVDLIENGIKAGEFKAKNIQSEQVALTIIATIEGAVMISRLSGKINNFNTILDSVTKMIEELD
ncbi:TetR family transcriptional regulator [Flavobacterium sp. 270]|uniref:TetR/AcrR family transcriptional regulator n=1 Tax=Flavobacterium sp. 270 TaxID=2512114 RepID=UPI001065A751|nr:TetR/AcrR family transcriptional regulator [Flavobacterium sp. 270]TDW51671.1 TetR family transcriptional regulator [Flavobacterium sp. 270]